MRAFLGWLLAASSLLLGALIFFGVITFVPPEPIGLLLGGLGRGLGWLFGTFLPTLGGIILDRLRKL